MRNRSSRERISVFLYKGKPIRDIRAALTRGCRDAGISYGRGTKDEFVFHMEDFLKSVDQNVDQVPLESKRG